MNKIQNLQKEISDFCIANSNADLVKKYSRYFKDGYDAYGVDGKLMEPEFIRLKTIYQLTPDEVFDLCDCLFKGKYEETAFGIMFIKDQVSLCQKVHFDALKRLMELYVTNWAHTDVLCMETLPMFFFNKLVSINDLSDWRISPSPWVRRAVPVSLIYYTKKEPQPIAELLAFINTMITDKEKPVHQGLGWFLREKWKKNPVEVEDYLLKIKDFAPRTIIQYATEKMDKEKKKLFKKLK